MTFASRFTGCLSIVRSEVSPTSRLLVEMSPDAGIELVSLDRLEHPTFDGYIAGSEASYDRSGLKLSGAGP